MFDELEAPSEEARRTWAVDVGDELKALSTFDLWYGLNTGEIDPESKVWRLGREAWSRACDVPELACALRLSGFSSIPGAVVERTTLDYVARPPSFEGSRGNGGAHRAPAADEEPLRDTLIKRDAPLEASDPEPPRLVIEDEPTPSPVVSETPAPISIATVRLERPSRGKRFLAAVIAAAAALSAGVGLAAATGGRVAADASRASLAHRAPIEVPLEEAAEIDQATDVQVELGTGPCRGTASCAAEDAAAEPPASSTAPVEKAASGRHEKTWSPTTRGQHRARRHAPSPRVDRQAPRKERVR